MSKEKVFAKNVSTAGQADYRGQNERKLAMAYSGSRGATATFTAFLVDREGNEYSLSGFRVSGNIDLVTSAQPGEIVEYTKPAGMILRIKWTKPSTGTVSAKAILT